MSYSGKKLLLLNQLLFTRISVTFIHAEPRAFNPKWDLPTDLDLNKYLGAVEKVVDYSARIIRKDHEVYISLAFALFLVNVNLVHALQVKGKTVPKSVQLRINNILDENDVILKVFKQTTVEKMKDASDESLYEIKIALMSLFNNASYWSEKLEKFYYTPQKSYTIDELSEMYSPFSLYMKKVDKTDHWTPIPEASDNCLASLTVNPTNRGRSTPRCRVADDCYDVVKGGTSFGYPLTHRLLLLLLARFNFGCAVFSERTDRAMARHFCSLCYAEATYIAEYDYALVDLFMEIIAVCTIDGHLQFLHRVWLDSILKFQKPEGCYSTAPVGFNATSLHRSIFHANMDKLEKFYIGDSCNQHASGLGAVALSAAVRFIMEEYY